MGYGVMKPLYLLTGLFQELVIVLTSWHVLRCVAVECQVIENGALGAPGDRWEFSLHAQVEAAAVIGLDVTGVVEHVTVGVHLCGVGAFEAVGKNLNSLSASSSDASVGPDASACELIEDEAGGACAQHGDTAGALVVLVAVSGIFVLEVSVHTWALNA